MTRSAFPVGGRLISAQADGAAPRVAVVNRVLAEQYFKGTEAVGRALQIDDNSTGPRTLTIVGVVDDLRETDLDGPVRPEVFISLQQVHADGLSFVTANQFWAVRVRSDPAAFGPTFLRTLRDVDPTIATAGLVGLRGYVDAAIAPRRFSDALVAFAVIALRSTLGIWNHGVCGRAASPRDGVRMALGATPASIVGLVLGRTLRLACVGVALGLAGAYAAGGFMSRLMFGVSPADPVLLGAVSALLFGTVLVASWLPGRRAARIDTLRALSAD